MHASLPDLSSALLVVTNTGAKQSAAYDNSNISSDISLRDPRRLDSLQSMRRPSRSTLEQMGIDVRLLFI